MKKDSHLAAMGLRLTLLGALDWFPIVQPTRTRYLETVSRSDDLSIAAGSSAELVASQINAIAKDHG